MKSVQVITRGNDHQYDVVKELSYDIPYVPSSWEKVAIMMKFAQVKKGNITLDLGSGDGRVVMAMAEKGACAHGIEIDTDRVIFSRKNIELAGLSNKAFIHHGSFWNIDMSAFDVITIFGVSLVMKKLEQKLIKEVKPTCRIVSHMFRFPNWPHIRRKRDIYLYTLV